MYILARGRPDAQILDLSPHSGPLQEIEARCKMQVLVLGSGF